MSTATQVLPLMVGLSSLFAIISSSKRTKTRSNPRVNFVLLVSSSPSIASTSSSNPTWKSLAHKARHSVSIRSMAVEDTKQSAFDFADFHLTNQKLVLVCFVHLVFLALKNSPSCRVLHLCRALSSIHLYPQICRFFPFFVLKRSLTESLF